MGCDIHMVLEQHYEGFGWVGVSTFAGANQPARERNYDRFAKLAGIRGDGPEPLGLPEDASVTARALASDWGGDGHSHSWIALEKALPLWLGAQRGGAIRELFGADEDRLAEYRLVFWFDN